MLMPTPTIDHYMTRQPWTIGRDATMSQAQLLMRQHQVRHLPVVDAGRLIGIVSERDLHFIEALPGGDPDEVTIDDVMVADVFTVGADQPADEVVETMANRKLGSALVVDRRGEVIGIFTTVDAMQVFADLLRRAAS